VNILTELSGLLNDAGVPFETGTYTGAAPDEYAVIVPLADRLELYADDMPEAGVQEARLSLFCKGSYIKLRDTLTNELLNAGYTITDRRYIGYENETKYHHYAIEAEKNYQLEI